MDMLSVYLLHAGITTKVLSGQVSGVQP